LNHSISYNSASAFFYNALNRKLKEDEFDFKDKITTPLKLKAIIAALDLPKCARVIGDYNNSRFFS